MHIRISTSIAIKQLHITRFTRILLSFFFFNNSCFKIYQGASIKNLEADSDGHVAAVKLEDGSTVDADTVILFLHVL